MSGRVKEYGTGLEGPVPMPATWKYSFHRSLARDLVLCVQPPATLWGHHELCLSNSNEPEGTALHSDWHRTLPLSSCPQGFSTALKCQKKFSLSLNKIESNIFLQAVFFFNNFLPK